MIKQWNQSILTIVNDFSVIFRNGIFEKNIRSTLLQRKHFFFIVEVSDLCFPFFCFVYMYIWLQIKNPLIVENYSKLVSY